MQIKILSANLSYFILPSENLSCNTNTHTPQKGVCVMVSLVFKEIAWPQSMSLLLSYVKCYFIAKPVC